MAVPSSRMSPTTRISAISTHRLDGPDNPSSSSSSSSRRRKSLKASLLKTPFLCCAACKTTASVNPTRENYFPITTTVPRSARPPIKVRPCSPAPAAVSPPRSDQYTQTPQFGFFGKSFHHGGGPEIRPPKPLRFHLLRNGGGSVTAAANDKYEAGSCVSWMKMSTLKTWS